MRDHHAGQIIPILEHLFYALRQREPLRRSDRRTRYVRELLRLDLRMLRQFRDRRDDLFGRQCAGAIAAERTRRVLHAGDRATSGDQEHLGQAGVRFRAVRRLRL